MTDDYSHLPPVMARVCRALEKADQFIRNGIEFGYIKMPDIETDAAHDALPTIEAALDAARQYRGEGVREAAQRLVNNALVDDYGSIIPDEDDWVALENALTYTPEEPSHD